MIFEARGPYHCDELEARDDSWCVLGSGIGRISIGKTTFASLQFPVDKAMDDSDPRAIPALASPTRRVASLQDSAPKALESPDR
jgi:hypothetical protein